MQKSSPSTNTQSIDPSVSPSAIDERKKWNQRKFLIIEINPKIQPIFQKIDSDFFEMFFEMGTFQYLEQHASMGSSEESKKIFFHRHYEKILIHFFQYLFDFQLQTLQFTQKHQTILSFGQWIENQVVFQIPQNIQLLNKKKSQLKPFLPKKADSLLSKYPSEIEIQQNFKRPFDQNDEEKQEQQIKSLSSSNKKLVVQDQQKRIKFVNFNSKESKQDFQKKEIRKSIEKYIVNGTLILDHEFTKRKILKVNGAKNPILQNEVNKETGRTKYKKKSSKQKDFEKSVEKPKSISKSNEQFIKKVAVIQSLINEPQIIVLETSQEKSRQKIFEEEKKICISDLDHGIEDLDKKSQISNGRVRSITSRDDIREVNIPNKDAQHSIENQISARLPLLSAHLIMQDIAERQKDIQLTDTEKQKRKLHQFRAKLSGLLRYSEKRFYIFPDFAPDLSETDSHQKLPNHQEQMHKRTGKSRKFQLNS